MKERKVNYFENEKEDENENENELVRKKVRESLGFITFIGINRRVEINVKYGFNYDSSR
jgi:hypothetical protein